MVGHSDLALALSPQDYFTDGGYTIIAPYLKTRLDIQGEGCEIEHHDNRRKNKTTST